MKTRALKSNRGFTLIEVLVAMMIMVGAIAVLANAWSGNIARLEKSRINNTTAFLLQRQMSEVEIKYRDKPLSEIPEEAAGDFGNAFPQYKWTLESKEFEMPNMSAALSAQDGGAEGMLIQIVNQMTEVFSKSIKEVKVTVIYTSRKNKRQLKNAITTYFIDYSKEIDLGIPGMPAGIPGGDAGGT